MIDPLEYKEIVAKLLEKTKAGKLPWFELEGQRSEQFYCDLENQYMFLAWKSGDAYGLTMKDQTTPNEIFSVKAEEEIYFSDPKEKEKFELLSSLYEAARRKALHVPERLASVTALLDKI